MYTHKPSERGQALVIIALAIIALVAMTGLAIDGGNAYSDRRHAQNAADASALAAGLARVRENPSQTTLTSTVEAAGLARAASNGYDDNGLTNTVDVYVPPISGEYAGNSSYLQVIIVSQVRTYFGRVVGIDHMTNNVNAVVRVEPFPDYPVLDGNAIISCSQSACPAVTVGGSSNTTLIDGGLFVNSNCEDDPNKLSFEVDGGGGLTAPTLCAVGGYENQNLNVGLIAPNCRPIDCNTEIVRANFDNECGTSVSVDPSDPNRLLPGKFSSNSKSFPPNGIDELAPGVYCIDTPKGFDITSGSLKGGCSPTEPCEGVVFYMQQGGINLNTDHIQLYSPKSGIYQGLLFSFSESNHSNVTINGNADNTFVGTLMAPDSYVKINGGSATKEIWLGQIISNTAAISGNAVSSLKYSSDDSYEPAISPQVEFIE